MVSIRIAIDSDAASLAVVHAAASGSRELSPTHFAELVEQHAGLIYLAEGNGSVVGFLVLHKASHPAVEGHDPIQLWQLYVTPEFHGSGVAARLMAMALDHARAHRHDVIWLGVSEHNARGLAFYRKHGFEPLGLHPVSGGGHAHQDIVMSCAVQ
jgi:ribosomal protein S18 acetylase RimI-like enzyme